MFGHLKKFLEGRYGAIADNLQQTAEELHIELMALPEVHQDFTTPEGAILCLEDAFRRKDIEAAVAAKDFKTEARLLLEKTGFKVCINDESVARTAGVLELSFRAHTTACWPDFNHLESFFPQRELLGNGIVSVTEVCRYPDGLFSRQEVLVVETPEGWRVLCPGGDDET
jgi:hypothetical protein